MSEEIRFAPLNDDSEEDCQCARCGSSVVFEDCYDCEDGFSHHDCGEDTCCCLNPENNMLCGVCRGTGGWWTCCSSAEWCEAHPIPGREAIERGKIEWFSVSRSPRGGTPSER